MKLFVDDNKECPAGWTPALTVQEALSILQMENVDVVSLDYDAGGVATFYAVAMELSKRPLAAGMAKTTPGAIRVWIHSGSTEGGKAMADVMGLAYEQCHAAAAILNRYEQHYHPDAEARP